MKKTLLSLSQFSLLVVLAMTCISCAHQGKDASLMIDTEVPSEEHVWSESRDIQEAVAAESSESEEVQLEAVEKEQDANSMNEQKSVSEMKSENELNSENEESELSAEISEIDSKQTPQMEVAKLDEAASPVEEVKVEAPENNIDPKPEAAREVASEPPADEVVAPSQVEPTIGVPNRLKKNNDPVPSKKPSSNGRIENSIETVKKAPVVEIVENGDALERVVPKPEEPMLNALGEEEESSPLLASVEIGNFIQRHWLATAIGSILLMVALYFFTGRKRNNESESI